ncbi:epithelial membrane protein 1 [Biomphalaria glabrata]|nr:epithelial membrane protein 1 [Biomphalaria glabrata]
MGLPVGFSVLHCVGTVLLGIGLILHIVGLATPSWASGTGTDSRGVSVTKMYGLWKLCDGSDCKDLFDSVTNIPDPWKAASAFSILGMVAGIAALGLACYHFIMRVLAKPETQTLKFIIMVAGILALLCVIISTSCFGGGVYQKYEMDKAGFDIGYSLILSAVGGIVICIGGVVFFVAS